MVLSGRSGVGLGAAKQTLRPHWLLDCDRNVKTKDCLLIPVPVVHVLGLGSTFRCVLVAGKVHLPSGMLGKSLASPLLTSGSVTPFCFSTADLSTAKPRIVLLNFSDGLPRDVIGGGWSNHFTPKKWAIHSTAQIEDLTLNDEDRKTWEACREALSVFSFSVEEEDKILGKAFGQFHSPYWGEERKREVPKLEIVNEILDYLRGLSLSNDDLCKLLKKFPEVLGCSLKDELKTNVQVLEKEWGIKGKSLRNLLLRNPKVLGYNVDCKGNCMAQCTRCWVRF